MFISSAWYLLTFGWNNASNPWQVAEIACWGLIICGLHNDLVHWNLWVLLTKKRIVKYSIKSYSAVFKCYIVPANCLRLWMIFTIHSSLTFRYFWLWVPQCCASHHTLSSLYGPLLPDPALISSAPNEPQGCSFLYLAAPGSLKDYNKTRSTTSGPWVWVCTQAPTHIRLMSSYLLQVILSPWHLHKHWKWNFAHNSTLLLFYLTSSAYVYSCTLQNTCTSLYITNSKPHSTSLFLYYIYIFIYDMCLMCDIP